MSVSDDLKEISTDLGTLQTAVSKISDDLTVSTPSASDTFVDEVITSLTNAGYTVTPPETTVPVTEG